MGLPMSMRDKNDVLTICEVLRQINDRLQDEKYRDIHDMLALAERMGKRMAAALRDYNEKLDPAFWMNNPTKKIEFDRSMDNYICGDPDRGLELLGGLK